MLVKALNINTINSFIHVFERNALVFCEEMKERLGENVDISKTIFLKPVKSIAGEIMNFLKRSKVWKSCMLEMINLFLL